MKNTRKGNDINVAWKILKNGNPFSLMGKDITIYLKSPFGKEKIKDFSVTGNIINWTFFGKDQKHSGEYSLELVINENEVGMITTDKCGFVNLVPCSCMEGGSDEGNIETESIELTTTLEYVAGEGGGSYDDSALWIEVTRLENEKADKTEIPTKLSQLEQDIEIGGESYDDTKVWEAIDELDRTKADSVDVANTLLSYPTKTEIADGYQPKGNYATESQVTELSAIVDELESGVEAVSEALSEISEKVNSSELNSGSYQQAVERANDFPGVFVWFLNQSGIRKPIWHVGSGVFVDAAGAIVELEPESAFRYTVILTQDNDTVVVPTAAGKVYDMVVDWGDGNTQPVSGVCDLKSVTHTYSGAAGTKYQITLRGIVPGLIFSSTGYGVPSQLYSIDDNSIQNEMLLGLNGKTDFKGCVNLTSLSSNALHNSISKSIVTFENCTSLKTLPASLLDGFELTIVSSMFYGCSSIVLSEEFMNVLATTLGNVTSLFYTFQGCKEIHITPDFFNYIQPNALTDVRSFLDGSGAIGDAKALYDAIQSKVASGVATQFCFRASSLTNRDQVPTSWGGTM